MILSRKRIVKKEVNKGNYVSPKNKYLYIH